MIDRLADFIVSLPPGSAWTILALVLLLAIAIGYRLIRARLLPKRPPPPATPDFQETKRPASQPEPIPTITEGPSGLFQRLKSGLSKTRRFLVQDIEALFTGGRDTDLMDSVEELLITSDVGVKTTGNLMASLSRHPSHFATPESLKTALKREILAKLLAAAGAPKPTVSEKPHVVMVVGVNGVGKTTTIGKLAARCTARNEKVLIAAADTFRAAAVEQLAVWAERSGAMLVRHPEGSDPAAVAFDGVEAGISRGVDRIFIDTAGRLHTKVNLMEELKKIKRTIQKKMPDAPHEVLLVLDATTGQNALTQARQFHEAIGVTAMALTKLDGTAKGGIVVSICAEMNMPLRYIGVGEQIEDLQDFDPETFVEALFS